MIYPSADKLDELVESRYALVMLAAKRAKQLRDCAPKLIETGSTNHLTVALGEIAAGKGRARMPDEAELLAVEQRRRDAFKEFEAPTPAADELLEAEVVEAKAEPVVDQAAAIAELLKVEGEEAVTEKEEEQVIRGSEVAELLKVEDEEPLANEDEDEEAASDEAEDAEPSDKDAAEE
jgi:DNA-directed RNA polymerase subunit omega